MKSALFAIALMISGAAVAQTDLDKATETDTAQAGGQIVMPSNADPEHDARGIAVISDPAIVPAGFNGTPAAAMGGPLIDPATGAKAEDGYRACTATITDNCVQTYERGRSAD